MAKKESRIDIKEFVELFKAYQEAQFFFTDIRNERERRRVAHHHIREFVQSVSKKAITAKSFNSLMTRYQSYLTQFSSDLDELSKFELSKLVSEESHISEEALYSLTEVKRIIGIKRRETIIKYIEIGAISAVNRKKTDGANNIWFLDKYNLEKLKKIVKLKPKKDDN